MFRFPDISENGYVILFRFPDISENGYVILSDLPLNHRISPLRSLSQQAWLRYGSRSGQLLGKKVLFLFVIGFLL